MTHRYTVRGRTFPNDERRAGEDPLHRSDPWQRHERSAPPSREPDRQRLHVPESAEMEERLSAVFPEHTRRATQRLQQ
eukprot:1145578-Pyramimonas_sp.AAC.1